MSERYLIMIQSMGTSNEINATVPHALAFANN